MPSFTTSFDSLQARLAAHTGRSVSSAQEGGEALISGLTHDSRLVEPGWLYVALPGRATHGARFIPQALARGAVAVAVPVDLSAELQALIPSELPTLWLAEPREEMAWLSEWVWGEPQRELELIGVTGTNGKTTTTSLLAEIIRRADGDVGLLGTIAARGGGLSERSSMTTLESSALHQRFASFVSAGLKRCVMEVSSIGISERRVAAARFKRAAFLNLSEDHLDYHGDMSAYLDAKERLVTELLAPEASVVVNMDDPAGERVAHAAERAGAQVLRLSAEGALSADEARRRGVSVYWAGLEISAAGTRGQLITPEGPIELSSPLLGGFNAYNIATAAALARSLGLDDQHIREGVEACVVSGRMESAAPEGPTRGRRYPKVLIDYAHTPDALERALEALRPLCAGRLWCLFGCGGDRDAHKRPLMGRAAASADLVILSSDNPRFEDPEQIISEALAGCLAGGMRQSPVPSEGAVWAHPDRAVAIETAVALMDADDLLLIAGKGHEPYQEQRGERRPFDDLAQASAALTSWLELDADQSRQLSTRLLCEAAGAELRAGAHRRLSGGEIDTRRLKRGQAFFCVQGARDGHDFALQALERGAGAVVTSAAWRPRDAEGFVEALERAQAAWLVVRDPEEALRASAALYRERAFQGVLIGLTGSNGKTSTKELLASGLSQRAPTLATEGNFNNHLGVPLTLLRLRPAHRFAVIEMGMSARGEIALLTELARPELGLITTVAAAHLEGLGSLEEVARAKGELFVGLGRGGGAVCSSQLPLYQTVMEGVSAPVTHADERLLLSDERVSALESVASLTERGSERAPLTLRLKLIGAHQLENARLALCAALLAEERLRPALEREERDPLVGLVRGLAACPAPAMRGELRALPQQGEAQPGTLWLDCYNANPQSTLASVKTFWSTGHQGALVLGSLKELGEGSLELHRELGLQLAEESRHVAAQGLVCCVGEEARGIAEGLIEGGYPAELVHWYRAEARDELIDALLEALRASPQASLFVKGSRSGRLEQVAEELLEALSQARAPHLHQNHSPKEP